MALILAFGLLCALLSRLAGAKAKRAKARTPMPVGSAAAPPLPAERPPERPRDAPRPADPGAPIIEPTPLPDARPEDGYSVYIDDNFHYMDERYRRMKGTFATLEEAVDVCRLVVAQSLRESYESGMPADELFEHYKSFGDDPFIRVPSQAWTEKVPFSGWTYARECAQTMCSQS